MQPSKKAIREFKEIYMKITKQICKALYKKEESGKPLTRQDWMKLVECKDEEQYSPGMIDYFFDLGSSVPECARAPLARALSLLPHEVVDFIQENCLIIALDEDNNGTYHDFRNPEFKKKAGFILFNSTLWRKKPIEIDFTVAHEVVHAFKGDVVNPKEEHKIDPRKKYKGFPKEEIEADRLAVKWLNKHYSKKSLMKLGRYLKIGNR